MITALILFEILSKLNSNLQLEQFARNALIDKRNFVMSVDRNTIDISVAVGLCLREFE